MFWEAAGARFKDREALAAGFEMVLRGRTPHPQILDGAPIWEREHYEALLAADKRADWAQLGERAQAFHNLPNLDLGAAQAVVGMAKLDWLRLVALADTSTEWLRAHVLLGPLELADAFRLAVASASDHVRFAALERVARREVRGLIGSGRNQPQKPSDCSGPRY